MNVLDTLDKELQKRTDLDRIEKIRYIYLRTCQLFSFDTRYYYAKMLNDEKFRDYLEKKEIDIENVTDFDVICYGYSKDILGRLLKELLGVESTIINNSYHSYLGIINDNVKWHLDGTLTDLMRVKLNLSPDGFAPSGIEFDYLEYLKQVDQKIGYEHKGLERLDSSLSDDEVIEAVNDRIMSSSSQTNFSDAKYYFEKLLMFSTFYDRQFTLIKSMADFYDRNLEILLMNKKTKLYAKFAKNDEGIYQLKRIPKSSFNEEYDHNLLNRRK